MIGKDSFSHSNLNARDLTSTLSTTDAASFPPFVDGRKSNPDSCFASTGASQALESRRSPRGPIDRDRRAEGEEGDVRVKFGEDLRRLGESCGRRGAT